MYTHTCTHTRSRVLSRTCAYVQGLPTQVCTCWYACTWTATHLACWQALGCAHACGNVTLAWVCTRADTCRHTRVSQHVPSKKSPGTSATRKGGVRPAGIRGGTWAVCTPGSPMPTLDSGSKCSRPSSRGPRWPRCLDALLGESGRAKGAGDSQGGSAVRSWSISSRRWPVRPLLSGCLRVALPALGSPGAVSPRPWRGGSCGALTASPPPAARRADQRPGDQQHRVHQHVRPGDAAEAAGLRPAGLHPQPLQHLRRRHRAHQVVRRPPRGPGGLQCQASTPQRAEPRSLPTPSYLQSTASPVEVSRTQGSCSLQEQSRHSAAGWRSLRFQPLRERLAHLWGVCCGQINTGRNR